MNRRTPKFCYMDPMGNAREFQLEDVPSLFLATTSDDVHNAIFEDGADIFEVFQGYNALHWHCDAFATSPSLIWALVEYGIDINALDQHKLPPNAGVEHPPIACRTALGYACFNSNIKAVRTLLELGANPQGSSVPLDTPFGSLQLGGRNASTPRLIYPSPLQDLLSQQFGGPTGVCPFPIHIRENHVAADDSDEDVPQSYHGGHYVQPECKFCSFGFDLHGAERFGVDQLETAISCASHIYADQVYLASMRIMKCGKLLLQYMNQNPLAGQLSGGHDANLRSPIDCLLRSVWYFLGPTMMCWRERFAEKFYGLDPATLSRKELVQFAARDPSVLIPDLLPWANLVLHASMASLSIPGAAFNPKITEYQGVHRILLLLEDHPGLDQFPEGQFANVTFSILAVGLRKPSSRPPPDATIANEEEEKVKQDDNTIGNSDGSDIVTIFDDIGDPAQLPKELAKEYRRGG